jgi:alanine racemase
VARPARAFIDLEALRSNYHLAKRLSAPGQALAVVKADAYGHGAVEVARTLEAHVPAFAVASLEEALVLRNAGIRKPILLLEGTFSADEVTEVARNNCWVMVENQQQVTALLDAQFGPGSNEMLSVWIKVDTGMHRLGFPPEDCYRVYQRLLDSRRVDREIVLATHLACADELENPFTRLQLDRFAAVASQLNAPASIANSPGLLGWPEARKEWNRPGYMLYGLTPFPAPHPVADQLRPVMTLSSAVIGLRRIDAGEGVGYGGDWIAARPSTIATVAIGYGDGYPRTAKAGTPVLINGRRCPLVGRVSMDMITVDVSDMHDVAIGSPAELWGKSLNANEVADHAGTNGYELVARMTSRVSRVYENRSIIGEPAQQDLQAKSQ